MSRTWVTREEDGRRMKQLIVNGRNCAEVWKGHDGQWHALVPAAFATEADARSWAERTALGDMGGAS